MKESEFVTKLKKWLKYNMPFSFLGEAKFINLEKRNAYYYKADKSLPDEINALKQAGKTVVYKISDLGGYGTPCDLFKLHNAAGFFFFYFYRRGEKKFYVIEVSDLEREIKSGAVKLTEERAEEICNRVGYLA